MLPWDAHMEPRNHAVRKLEVANMEKWHEKDICRQVFQRTAQQRSLLTTNINSWACMRIPLDYSRPQLLVHPQLWSQMSWSREKPSHYVL